MDSRTFLKSALVLGFLAIVLLWTSINYAQVATSFSGNAGAASGKNGVTFNVDPITIPSAGGSVSLSDNVPQPLPSPSGLPPGCVGHCDSEAPGIDLSITGSGISTLSTASDGAVDLYVGSHRIIARFLATTASASCPISLGQSADVASTSSVTELSIDFVTVLSPDIPNPGPSDAATFPLGLDAIDGIVSVNQITSSTATATLGDITVNALQIDMTNGDHMVVASSRAGVTCPTAPSGGGCKGKVTGGGTFMLDGKRQTFGFVAGTKKDGTAFGNLNYINHGNGLHLQGSVQSVNVDTATDTATVTGTLKTGGEYTLVVTDAGEPGRADTFSLSSSLVNTGSPIALSPQGGNIQIHKGCGGPKK